MPPTKIEIYRMQLRALAEPDWEAFLLSHSGLPGPRGNLELAQAVAGLGRPAQFERWLKLDADQAPTNAPKEYLAFCGVVGLGRLLAEGQARRLQTLRRCAADPRRRLPQRQTLMLVLPLSAPEASPVLAGGKGANLGLYKAAARSPLNEESRDLSDPGFLFGQLRSAACQSPTSWHR
jgi:hypothetical protein